MMIYDWLMNLTHSLPVSAVQVLPELQKKVKHLYSYQRTPTWIANRYQLKYYRGVQILFRWFPFLMRLQRFLLYVIVSTFLLRMLIYTDGHSLGSLFVFCMAA